MDQIHQKNHIYIWLLISCTLLIVLIWVGGLTRLTGSGLSITQWEIFSGILPPFTDQQWSKYFSLYKQIPEYKKINYGMSLNEFKIIFWWEYIHRFLARFLVIIYFLPFIYFAITKQIKKNKITFFTIIFFLFLTQGFIGWYMVKSGLVSETDVSHFRLAAHLSLALIIYSMIFWSLLNVNFNMSLTFKTETTLIFILFLFVLIQIVWGAFTSGLNAGLLYQTWPLMNENFIADDIEINKLISFLSISNPSYVQLIHRFLAYFIILYSLVIYFLYFRKKKITKPFKFIFTALSIQIILGILTLTSGLNIFIASLHQMGSIFLISSIIYAIFYANNFQNLIDTQLYKQ